MKRGSSRLVIVVDRKTGLAALAALVLAGGAGLVSSQQLTMTATYPIPAGVYNQIVTTGNSGTSPANTTLNRNAGSTILVPQAGNAGSVGVGVASPSSYAKLDVNTSNNKSIHTMDAAYGGLLIGYNGPTIQARTTSDGNTANLSLQGWGGSVGIGMAAPASTLSVAGGVQMGDDGAACAAAKAGTLRWHSGALEVCDGASWTPTQSGVRGQGGGSCAYLSNVAVWPATGCFYRAVPTCGPIAGRYYWGYMEYVTACAPGWIPSPNPTTGGCHMTVYQTCVKI